MRRFTPMTHLMAALLALSPLAAVAQQPAQANGAATDEENPHLWQPRTRSVAVFKNGLGFFMREGQVSTRDGWVVAREIPPAKFGTLAIYSHQADEMVDVVGSGPGEVVEFDGVDAPKDLATRRARLLAARQLNVQLTYDHRGQERSAAGKLVSVADEFVVLEAGEGNFAVVLSAIKKMQVLDLPLRVHVASQADSPSPRTNLGMAYLREGITWIPEYSLRVLDDQTAELTLRGTLVNEAEDLIHADVHFVVGVPHFVHTQYLAPVAVGQVIRTIGAAVAPPGLQTQIMNRAAIASNAITADQFDRPTVIEQAVPPAATDLKIGGLPQLENPAGSDYTVYTKKDLTVRRGERAIVTLFVQRIRYGHVYRWSPPEAMQHFLVLKNDTDTAWTTGPCLAISSEQPLSEDLIKYTPRGGRCELPVSSAINIAHEQTEAEVDRKFKAHSPSQNVHLDLVTLNGELRLRNFEPQEVEVVVVATVPGKPLEASDSGMRAADPTRLRLLERQGTIRWTVRLEAGASRTLRYSYERYVPSS